MNTEEKLKAYSIEVHGIDESYDDLTIDSLIESHRRLRKINQEHQSDYLTVLAEARRRGIEQGLQKVCKGDYIKVSELKSMTMLELSNILVD